MKAAGFMETGGSWSAVAVLERLAGNPCKFCLTDKQETPVVEAGHAVFCLNLDVKTPPYQ